MTTVRETFTHLPGLTLSGDRDRLTCRQMIDIAGEVTGRRIAARIVPAPVFALGALVGRQLREATELLPRHRQDNIVGSSNFAVTTYRDGITQLPSVQPAHDERQHGYGGDHR